MPKRREGPGLQQMLQAALRRSDGQMVESVPAALSARTPNVADFSVNFPISIERNIFECSTGSALRHICSLLTLLTPTTRVQAAP